MSINNLSGLSFARNIATQLSGQCRAVQKACNNFYRNIFHVAPSSEKLIKQTRAQLEQMNDHQHSLNKLFRNEMQSENSNFQKNTNIKEIVMSQIRATNDKHGDCGYFLTFDTMRGVTMQPHRGRQELDSSFDQYNPKYKLMKLQKDSLNKLYYAEMRKHHEVFNGKSALVHIINSQIKDINIRYPAAGYQLAFDMHHGVTMHPVATAKK